MRHVNLFSFAFGNLAHRPARTALTVSAMSLGIAAVVALTGISWGFEASWQKANDARGTDLIITRLASENAMPSAFVANGPEQKLKSYPHVQECVGLLSEMLSVSDDTPPVFVFGWAFDSYLWRHLTLLRGHRPTTDDEATIMLGSLAAELLHKKPGDVLEIEGDRFTVAGVYESPAVVENGAVLMTLSQAQRVTDKPGKVNVLNLKLDPQTTGADLEALKARVHVDLPGFVAMTSGELVANNTMVRISKAMSNATILISSLVGALIVFNTMLMSINERKRDIGVLLALGWRRTTIMQLVVCESIVMTLSGGVLGIAAGVGIAWGLEHLDLLRGKIDAVYSAPFFLAVLGLAILIGLMGGCYPAFHASRLRPAQALRHE